MVAVSLGLLALAVDLFHWTQKFSLAAVVVGGFERNEWIQL